jgi:hypothetical protein
MDKGLEEIEIGLEKIDKGLKKVVVACLAALWHLSVWTKETLNHETDNVLKFELRTSR